jgi:cytochrome P450
MADASIQDAHSTDTHPTPRLGWLEFLRKVKEDQLSVLAPELFGQDILYNRILFLHTFLINKPEYIEHVLLTHQRNYRKSDFLRSILGPLLGEGLLISEGEFWRRQRRIAAPGFHARRVAELVTAMTACTDATLARWDRTAGPFDMAAEMLGLTLDIVARTMFSTDVGGEVASLRRLTDVVVRLRPSTLDLLGLPGWIPRPQPAVYRRAIAEFEALVARFLAERRADGRDRGDLLSMLLAARDPESGEGMSDKQLRDEIITILLAGHETVANALTWTWYLLALHPQAEARMHQELDRVLGGRAPTFADLAELEWTRMVIDEAMRLYPPAHTISRTAIGEDCIGGMRVPAGAAVTINIFVTHRNPNLWEEPERFAPERFAPDAAARRHRFSYLPFGGGPRICIGNGLALVEAKAILATIAQRYRVRLVPGHPVEPIGLVTLRAKSGVQVTLEPRAGGAKGMRAEAFSGKVESGFPSENATMQNASPSAASS